MTKPSTYFDYHQQLLRALLEEVKKQASFARSDATEEDQLLVHRLASLCQRGENREDYLFEGQQLIAKIVAAYPQLTPLVPRDLFWFFGGDCLHFMPDEEIARYQTLDQLRFEAEAQGKSFCYEQERAKVFKLH